MLVLSISQNNIIWCKIFYYYYY